MASGERKQEILELLNEKGFVTVDFLARRLHISPSSIRRDLTALERQGKLTRSHGGAEVPDMTNRQISFSLRRHENIEAKKAIARAAARLLKEGQVVFVDGSSTCFFLFRELVAVKGITVVTNSVDGLFFLTGYGVKAISTGGVVSPENRSVLVGEGAGRVFESMHADLAFYSSQALSDDGVIYDCYSDEVPLRQKMLQNAEKRVFLVDESKLGRKSAYRVGDLSQVELLVCDVDLSVRFSDRFPNVTCLHPYQ